MELPVFNDNLKSSGEWTVRLARERELYQEWLERGIDLRAAGGHATVPEGEAVEKALALVANWATAPDPHLDPERLGEVNKLVRGSEAEGALFRSGPPALLSVQHDPAPASMLPRLLDLAFDWFTTEGFAELHPLEQATLVYLRLLDLSPFAAANETTALVAAGFYTRRGGFPARILPSGMMPGVAGDEARRYKQALESAFGMLTQPLVEFFAEALARSMREERGVSGETG